MKIACLSYEGSKQWVVEKDGMWLKLQQSLEGILHSGDVFLSIKQATGRPLVSVAEVETDTDTPIHYAAPLDTQEVWACGMTYATARKSRKEDVKDKDQEIYQRLYETERPQLFFKATPGRTVGHGDAVGIRADAKWNIPEAELALLIDRRKQVVGYSIGNDLTSRDIKNENPLYFSQAKIYNRSASLGPVVVMVDDLGEAKELSMSLEIDRMGKTIVSEVMNTSDLYYDFEYLIDYLFKANNFAKGVWLMTGTNIHLPEDFTLVAGDTVRIGVEGIGVLENDVVVV